MQIKTGSYAGNSTDNTPITGVGFQPDAVWISASGKVDVLCTSDMGANVTKPLTGATATFSGGVKSLDSDGFTLGTDGTVNATGTTYYWKAFKDNGAGDFAHGSYAGNGSDDRDISVGFQPDIVIVGASTAQNACWRTSTMSGDNSQTLGGSLAANQIQAFGSTTFQVGTSGFVNSTSGSPTYYWIAFKVATSLVAVTTHTGNGSDNRDFHDIGFSSNHVFVKSTTSTVGVEKPSALAGDASFSIDASLTSSTDRIQSISSDGWQAGTSSTVNSNTVVYNSAFWKDGSSTPTATKIPPALLFSGKAVF